MLLLCARVAEYLIASNDAESDQAYLKIAFIVSSDTRDRIVTRGTRRDSA